MDENEIPLHTLEFMERHFFHEYDEAYERYNEGMPVYDEVIAYEKALEAVTRLRKKREKEQEETLKNSVKLTEDTFDELDGFD